MVSFQHKRIADPIHGTIGLSAFETKIIDCPVFQRLRSVKQLGLASYAFPGADYSRFSHSIGVCHVTGRILDSLRIHANLTISEDVVKLYRAAALLHDLGHYPFSHAFETVVKDHYSARLIVPVEEAPSGEPAYGPPFGHEQVGREIMKTDPLLSALLTEEGITSEAVYAITKPERELEIRNLISGDLDADRIDFLLRTSHFSGLPYGSVDIEYLLTQMTLDDEKQICISEKALKAADHFLLCRYFDYQQVVYHKTVSGLEEILKQILRILLKEERLDLSRDGIRGRIEDQSWSGFDDSEVLQEIRGLAKEHADENVRAKANAIVSRRPPASLCEIEQIGDRETTSRNDFAAKTQAVEEHLDRWAHEFGIDRSRWFVWSLPGRTLTSVGARVPVEAAGEDTDEVAQTIRIARSGGASESIVGQAHSLMSVLSNHALYALRVYVVLPDEKREERAAMVSKIKTDLPHHGWKS